MFIYFVAHHERNCVQSYEYSPDNGKFLKENLLTLRIFDTTIHCYNNKLL